VLSYEETRENCIAMDSDLYPTVDWPYLRVWTREDGVEDFYQVRLADHAIPIEGGYSPAMVELELQGSPTAGDYAGISFLDEHHTYQLSGTDTLDSAAQAIVDSINSYSTRLQATRTGATIRLIYVGEGQSLETSTTGANGNRLGVYGFVSGAETETWSPQAVTFSGGLSPTKWRVRLDLSSLIAIDGRSVPMDQVRKMRWTWAAEVQSGAYQRSEFDVAVSNWSVTGSNRAYRVAGPNSRRIEDDDRTVAYSGEWNAGKGNFSGGSIRSTSKTGATVTIEYQSPGTMKFSWGRDSLSTAHKWKLPSISFQAEWRI
jgi:hypothetical protein